MSKLSKKDFSEFPDSVNYNKIEEGLFIGNVAAAMDIETLKQLHISHILTIDSEPLQTKFLDTNMSGMQFCYIKVNDMSTEDMLSKFPTITNFIADGQEKGNVLVHCYFGVSRSASAVIAFLMKKYNIELDEALKRVKSKRNCIGPNSGFLSQLLLYEKLNYSLDLSKISYRLYRLTVAGEAFKKGKFSLENITNFYCSSEDLPMHSPLTTKCRRCRTTLLTENSIIPHTVSKTPNWSDPEYVNETEKSCCPFGIFASPCKWMNNENAPQGKLNCPKCGQKLGSFNWIKGCECPCSASMSPGFFFIPSKVDVCRS